MPSWSDENGRYWWTPPGKSWLYSIEIPHPPVSTEPGCTCAMCVYEQQIKQPRGKR